MSSCFYENKQLHVRQVTYSLYSLLEAHITSKKIFQTSDFPLYLRKQSFPDFNFSKTKSLTFARAVPVNPL